MWSNPRDTFDLGSIDDSKKLALINSVKLRCSGMGFVDATRLCSTIYDRKNEYGLAPLFDKATHLVTRNRHIATEDLNINFIFKDPNDNDIYENIYEDLSMVLMYLNLLQIELYSMMGFSRPKYKQWLWFTSIGSFLALFRRGNSPILRHVNRDWKEFLLCPACEAPFRVSKAEAPCFFITETVVCKQCGTEHHFPLGWLLSKTDWLPS